jgi:hypothetical protein
MMGPVRLLAALAIALQLAACAHPRIDDDATPPRPAKRPAPAAGNNWPMPPERAEQQLARAPMELRESVRTEQGVAGAMKATVVFPPETRPVTIKWKVVPADDMDGWNNNARKELAAYAVQKWFLRPEDYVVPTAVVRCVPLATYRRLDPAAEPTVPGTQCVLGQASLWLEHVTVPDVILDAGRFDADYPYAYHLSNFNVLTFLIRHRDGRAGNILVADRDDNRRVFGVDNGISFDGLVYNFLVPNWDEIRVPAIRRDVVTRLRRVDRAKLDALATLVELRADGNGILQPVRPTRPIDPLQGVRVAEGRVQMGLTRDEIDGVSARLQALLQQVDEGTLPVF